MTDFAVHYPDLPDLRFPPVLGPYQEGQVIKVEGRIKIRHAHRWVLADDFRKLTQFGRFAIGKSLPELPLETVLGERGSMMAILHGHAAAMADEDRVDAAAYFNALTFELMARAMNAGNGRAA